MITLLRSLFALSLATLPAPAADQDRALLAKADELEKRFAASKRDESIGDAFVEKRGSRSRRAGPAAKGATGSACGPRPFSPW